MSKKLVLTLVLIMLITVGVSPVMGAREGTWELTTTIPNLPLACGVYIHPSGDFVIVSERAGLLVQMSPVDYSVLKTLQLPVATDGDSLCWATPLVDHSLIYYPDEHGDIFVVDPVELTIQQVIDTAGSYRLVITQDAVSPSISQGFDLHWEYDPYPLTWTGATGASTPGAP